MVLGVHSLRQAEDTKQVFDIQELHNHPEYNSRNYNNDIALIKVSSCVCVLTCQKCTLEKKIGKKNVDSDRACTTQNAC